MTNPTNILVATDFGPQSDATLACARTMAEAFGATLHALHVLDDDTAFPAEQLPDDLREQCYERRESDAREWLGLALDAEIQSSRANVIVRKSPDSAREIITYARDAHIDLIVVGSGTCGALMDAVLGTVAQRVLRLAPCPVLTVRKL